MQEVLVLTSDILVVEYFVDFMLHLSVNDPERSRGRRKSHLSRIMSEVTFELRLVIHERYASSQSYDFKYVFSDLLRNDIQALLSYKVLAIFHISGEI